MVAWILECLGHIGPAPRICCETAFAMAAVANTNERAGGSLRSSHVSECIVPHSHAAPLNVTLAPMDADEIEQRIIRAYLRLAFTPPERNGSRAVTIVRFGGLEARLTEVPADELPPGMPSFWLEVYSSVTRSIVDSCGCTEFDDQELAAAVEMITNARQRAQSLQ